ncbi:coat protein [Erysiphe necator associated totivirus 5]|nr:coat protein [Erysiphe necator associated totivirus 5]
MFTNYLNSFTKLGIGKALDVTLGDGRFTMTNKTRAHAKMGVQMYSVGLDLATNFQVSGWLYERQSVQAENYYYGYNKQYLDEDGVYDQLRAIDDYSRTVPGLRLNKIDLAALVTTSTAADSHEAYIYNMLASWFTAKLYKDMKGENNKFEVRHDGYSDSHVKFGFFSGGATTSSTIELGAPFDGEPANLGWDTRTLDNYWDRPYTFRYSATNVPQISFYMAHLWGRTGKRALNVDIAIEGLDPDTVYLDPVGPLRNVGVGLDMVPWHSPDTLWLWIMDYVRLNRVEQAFAASFELLGALATQPMPSYQESNLWHYAAVTVNLAPFAPVRARVPSNLRGEPNLHDLNATTVMSDEARAPSNYIVVSAALNYAAWMGLYGLVGNYSRDMIDWRAALSTYDAELAILNTPEAYGALISLISGKEIFTCMNTNCHLTYNLTAMAGFSEVVPLEVLEQGYPDIKIHALPSFVSGSLFMGSVACPLDSMVHLQSAYTFNVSQYNDVDAIDAAKAASLYRLFGHDVDVVHISTHEKYPVYANVSDATVATYELLARTRDFDRMRLLSSQAREGRTYDLPDVSALSTYGSVSVTIERPTLTVCAWNRRQPVHRPTVVLASRRQAITFKVANTSQYRTAHFNVGRRQDKVQMGFHEVKREVAPSIPQGHTELVGTLAPDPMDLGEPVRSVE